jgi:hypothetical protein
MTESVSQPVSISLNIDANTHRFIQFALASPKFNARHTIHKDNHEIRLGNKIWATVNRHFQDRQ